MNSYVEHLFLCPDSYLKTNEIRTFFNPIHKNNSIWIKDLNVSLGTIKLLEENTVRILFELSCSNIFLDPYPKAKEKKSKNKQMGLSYT